MDLGNQEAMDNLTLRYLHHGGNHEPDILSTDNTWTLIKVIASLVRVEHGRNDVLKPELTKWEGFTLSNQDFQAKLEAAGISSIPNLGERTQTPQFLASLHAQYLEKTSNSLALLRLVETALNDNTSNEGKKLRAISVFMSKEDPVLAIEALCNQVILTCAFLSERLKLARKVSNSIEAYENQRGNLMEISHGAQDGRISPQTASEKLREVKKNDRDIRLQCHRFYS